MDRKGSHGPLLQPDGHEATRLQELRSLLSGPEQRQLAKIFKRLDDPVRRAKELAQTLPDALSMGGTKNGRIARALQPAMDSALKNTVRKDPKSLADAIFPALGPAIRKSISATLLGMIQSLNHVLNQSFSLQGLKWRIEAIRTQRPFAEVVLLHTLVYRVEQVFLIHSQTGLVLQHAYSEDAQKRDPDLVSGMFTAIQDFVHDSFDAQSGEVLDTLRMDGDHSVWIEQGDQVVMAIVIRGTPPQELRNQFRELLDKVGRLYADTLDHFDGETAPFAMIKPDLEDALTFKVRSEKPRISPLLWILVAVAVCLAGLWSLQTFKKHRQWQNVLSQLKAEVGIVVTAAERRGGRYVISGLKDPMARDPQEIISASQVHPDKVQTLWQPYRAMDDAMVLRRARKILKPPATVELELFQSTLLARGRAQHGWVERFRRLASTIAGVDAYDERQLEDEEMASLTAATETLENLYIDFKVGQAALDEAQNSSLQITVDTVLQIQNLGRAMRVPLKITILGHADPSGYPEFNLQLSQQRAHYVMRHLIRNGSDPSLLNAIGVGSKGDMAATNSIRNQRVLRHVTFRTLITSGQVTEK